MSLLQDTLASGIEPIVIEYEDVRLFDGKSDLVRTALVINSLELGVLTYREYRFVARRTKQGNHLVRRHLLKLCRELPRLAEERPGTRYTVPAYARLLRDGELADMIIEMLEQHPDVSPSMLCIELSADLVYEDMDAALDEIQRIRELGVGIAIFEVGDEYCPIFRLPRIPFDYAFLDEYATAALEGDDAERIVGSITGYLHTLKASVIAPSLDTEEKIERAKALGCDGYTEAYPTDSAEIYIETYTQEPAEETAEEPVEEIAEEPVEEIAEEPVEEIAEEPVEELAEEPVEETAEEPVEETAEEPVVTLSEETFAALSDESDEESAEEPKTIRAKVSAGEEIENEEIHEL